ncbi:DUF6932 family protein [Spirosoma pomorum]
MKLDATPIITSGFQVIGEWQLDKFFLEPFQNTIHDPSHRSFLIKKLRSYLQELRKFEIPMEVWLDGPFTTLKPDPEDIDIAVLASFADIEQMPDITVNALDRLVLDRDLTRARYYIDVYLVDKDNPLDIDKWVNQFSQGHYSIRYKGIFKILINHV